MNRLAPVMFRSRNGVLDKERGVALVLVLWMLMLLSVVANGLAMTARTESRLAANLVAQARAEAAADAAIFKALADLAAPAGDSGRWHSNGLGYLWTFDGMNVRVRIISEAGKIDLNEAPPALLAGLFRAIGVARDEADVLADAVVDWRDRDDFRSLRGAEREEYARAGKNYGPANAPFETIEELSLVLGFGDGVFRALREFVTVYSPSGTVAAAVAEPTVLLAIPGASPDLVDAYILQRHAALASGLPPPPFAPAPGTASGQDYLSIRAEAYSGDNARFSREAVVRLTGNPSKPFLILAWRALAARMAKINAS